MTQSFPVFSGVQFKAAAAMCSFVSSPTLSVSFFKEGQFLARCPNTLQTKHRRPSPPDCLARSSSPPPRPTRVPELRPPVCLSGPFDGLVVSLLLFFSLPLCDVHGGGRRGCRYPRDHIVDCALMCFCKLFRRILDLHFSIILRVRFKLRVALVIKSRYVY